MFIEITAESVPGLTRGAVVDVKEGIGRAYIEAGQAVESDAGKHINASLAGALADSEKRLKDELRTLRDELRGTAANPPRTPGHIEAGEASADRGKKGFGDILRCITVERMGDPGASAHARERLEKSYGLNRSVGGVERAGSESLTGGQTYGYLVRPEFLGETFRIMAEQSVMQGIRSVPVGSSVEVRMPAWDQYTNPGAKTSSYFAGISLNRLGEASPRIATDAALDEIIFKVTDLTGFTQVSRDLMVDSYYPIDAQLQELFGAAFAWRKDYDYIRGSGAGEPLGWFNAGCLIGGGGVSGNATRKTANQILYDDLAWMLSKLHPNCWAGACWVANTSTIPYLMGIQSAAGTFVYQPNSLISQADRPSVYGPGAFQGTLLGFPVRFTEKVPALGSTGDLSLICPPQYGEVLRSGVEVGVSEHYAFNTDQISFRWKLRNDGRPMWRSTYKAADGSNTTSSPFITLVAA